MKDMKLLMLTIVVASGVVHASEGAEAKAVQGPQIDVRAQFKTAQSEFDKSVLAQSAAEARRTQVEREHKAAKAARAAIGQEVGKLQEQLKALLTKRTDQDLAVKAKATELGEAEVALTKADNARRITRKKAREAGAAVNEEIRGKNAAGQLAAANDNWAKYAPVVLGGHADEAEFDLTGYNSTPSVSDDEDDTEESE